MYIFIVHCLATEVYAVRDLSTIYICTNFKPIEYKVPDCKPLHCCTPHASHSELLTTMHIYIVSV